MTGTAHVQQTIMAALEPGSDYGLAELVKLTGLQHRQVSNAVCRLITRKYVERTEKGCYQLTAAGQAFRESGEELSSGPIATNLSQSRPRQPKKDTLRDRLWRAIRINYVNGSKFTILDLLAIATTGDEKNANDNARRFLTCLVNAGVLHRFSQRAEGRAATSNGYHRYQMVRDLGPKTPILRLKEKTVVDTNSMEVLTCRNG